MKKTNKINLNQLAKKEVDLKKSELKTLRGGDLCVCVCVNPGAPTGNYPVQTTANTTTVPHLE